MGLIRNIGKSINNLFIKESSVKECVEQPNEEINENIEQQPINESISIEENKNNQTTNMNSNITVILGTAHAASTPGKRSPDGKFREYAWSRKMCKMVKTRLIELGINCIIDIEEDEEISLKNRVSIVNAICAEKGVKNCIYVSIHNNAAANGTWANARGFSIWIYEKASQKSKDLALSIFNEAEKSKLLGNRSVPSTKYHTSNFYVCKNTACPAVLTENLFQDNKEDVAYLESDEGMSTICNMHVNGIINYINSL